MVIIIHSMVSFGYVGNNTISSVLQMGEIEVVAVPTVLYSNHLGHSTVGGDKISEDLLASVLDGILELGIIKKITTIITGFIGSAEQVKIIADFVERTKKLKPEIRYLCDPVMGDTDKGQYVDPNVPNALIKQLVPLADLLTPNQYEMETIIGRQINIDADMSKLVKEQFNLTKQEVIITGVNFEILRKKSIYNYILTGKSCSIIKGQKLDLHPPGTGDMFTAYICLLMHKGIKLKDAVELSADIVFKVLLNMSKENRSEFGIRDILCSMNILKEISSGFRSEINCTALNHKKLLHQTDERKNR